MALSFMEGNEAVAMAAVHAGCRFFAGYPITPATTVYQHLLKLLPPVKGICMQGEDEIASIGFCIGASMGGLKAMTATSGPGISLFSEQISFAIGSEVPLVIVDVQRLGPSTGSATKGADGDIQFLRWSNSGGLPVIVLAPVDVSDCFVLTVHAFNLAEKYRCPVFLASNKEIGLTRESINLDDLDLPPLIERPRFSAHTGYQPYLPDPITRVPPFLPMGGSQLVRQTSSNHGPDGFITGDPEILGQTIRRLDEKLTGAVDTFTFYKLEEYPEAETLLIVYGVTARAARESVKQARKNGSPVSLLILKTLYPVPESLIAGAISKVKRIVVIEMNLGQYVLEIKRLAASIPVISYGQMDGELITPETITHVMFS